MFKLLQLVDQVGPEPIVRVGRKITNETGLDLRYRVENHAIPNEGEIARVSQAQTSPLTVQVRNLKR